MPVPPTALGCMVWAGCPYLLLRGMRGMGKMPIPPTVWVRGMGRMPIPPIIMNTISNKIYGKEKDGAQSL